MTFFLDELLLASKIVIVWMKKEKSGSMGVIGTHRSNLVTCQNWKLWQYWPGKWRRNRMRWSKEYLLLTMYHRVKHSEPLRNEWCVVNDFFICLNKKNSHNTCYLLKLKGFYPPVCFHIVIFQFKWLIFQNIHVLAVVSKLCSGAKFFCLFETPVERIL